MPTNKPGRAAPRPLSLKRSLPKRLSEQQRKTIGIAAHRTPPNFVLQFVIGTEMKIRVVNKLESWLEHFLDNQHRVDPASVFRVVGFHVPSRVVDDAIQSAGLQSIEHSAVDASTRVGVRNCASS